MSASPKFKASGFAEAVMQINFEISHDLLHVISTFSVLVGILIFISSEFKLSFYFSTALGLRTYGVSDFYPDHAIEVSRHFLGGAP